MREVMCTTSIVCFRPRTSIIVLASLGTRLPTGLVDTDSLVVVGVLLGYKSPKRPSMQCGVHAMRNPVQAAGVGRVLVREQQPGSRRSHGPVPYRYCAGQLEDVQIGGHINEFDESREG